MTDSGPIRSALSPQEVADELGLTVRTVQRLMKSGEMPHVVISARIRKVTRAQLDRYLEQLESKAG